MGRPGQAYLVTAVSAQRLDPYRDAGTIGTHQRDHNLVQLLVSQYFHNSPPHREEYAMAHRGLMQTYVQYFTHI